MLADRLAEHDMVGQWMAHHLAELVTTAQDDANTSVEQRQAIVDLILKVWAHRRSFDGGRAPLDDFANVLAALDRLGDERPWGFLRPLGSDYPLADPDPTVLPLAQTAVELERVARETALQLLWLAAEDAKDKNQRWLAVADDIAATMESDVTAVLRRLQVRATRRRLNEPAAATSEPGSSGDDATRSVPREAGQVVRGGAASNAERFREMANQLVDIADLIDNCAGLEVRNRQATTLRTKAQNDGQHRPGLR